MQASKICREISASELQPPSLRPQTTDIVVRRILGHALQKSSLRDLVRSSRNSALHHQLLPCFPPVVCQ